MQKFRKQCRILPTFHCSADISQCSVFVVLLEMKYISLYMYNVFKIEGIKGLQLMLC